MRSAVGPPLRDALLHLHACSVSAASFSRRPAYPDPPFFDLTEEPKMAGMRSGLVIMTALLLSDSVVLAQQAGKPCASDIKTLCVGIQHGEGRIKGCIKSHMAEVSDSCKNAMAQTAAGKKILGRGDL